MKRVCTGALALLIAGFLCVAPLARPAFAAAATQSVAFPMYQYPTLGTLWSDVEAAGASMVPWVIADPASGPGTSADSNYTASLNTLTAGGQRAIGYIDSSYQSRPMSAVVADVDKWYQLYPQISGIFIDQVQNGSASDLCYAATAYNYIKSKHPSHLVVQNFGANVEARYEPYGDIFANAENYYSAYTSWAMRTDGFENNAANANRFWHIVHTTSSGQLANALSLTRANNAGWVLVTDETMPNPYSAVPSYWSSFLSGVNSLPRSSIPNRGLTALPAGCIDLNVQNAVTTSPSAKQTTMAITSTVSNASSTNTSWGNTKLVYDLPNGVVLNSVGGSGWTCSGATCTLPGNIAPGSAAAGLQVSLAVSCAYVSGSVSVTLHNFANNTATDTIAVTKPTGCSTVINSGGSGTMQQNTPTGGGQSGAPTQNGQAVAATPTTTTTSASTADTPTDTTTSPEATNTKTAASQPVSSGNTALPFAIGGGVVVVASAVAGFVLWRRHHSGVPPISPMGY